MSKPQHRSLVLIVEDDAKAAHVLAQLLREDGFEIEIILDGPAAMARVQRLPRVDALVVDYRLPGVDGLAVARRALEYHPELLIVMITSYLEVVRDLLQKVSTTAVMVPKPIAYEDLVGHLERARTAQ